MDQRAADLRDAAEVDLQPVVRAERAAPARLVVAVDRLRRRQRRHLLR
jgi:hypothetical protein